MALTSQQLSQILAGAQGNNFYKKPLFPQSQTKAFLPQFDPSVPQSGFMNSPQMAGFTPKPLMVSQKPIISPQVQVNNQGQDFAPIFAPQAANDGGIGALLKAFTAPHGHHFGIGGAEISDTNPYGNPGGDPFKNGFFKGPQPTTPGMMFLGGTPNPNATQFAMIKAAQLARTTTPPIPIPGGDPQARAFWSQMGY